MANIYKTLASDDITSTRTLLHENVPVTGAIVSGSTYEDLNIKNYSHGMFQSVYDYPILSSSANHLFDLTCGYFTGSALNNTTYEQNTKKVNVYGQMAQVLVGYDAAGSVRAFDRDGDLSEGDKISEAYFINLSRLLAKDEIRKGEFRLTVGTGSAYAEGDDNTKTISVGDFGAADSFKVNSPAGDYAILYTGSAAEAGSGVGLLYYQAGIAVLTASLFATGDTGDIVFSSAGNVEATLTGSDIQENCNSLRYRIQNLVFDNTIELNSTIYFCNANHNEFNYSSNPTYLSGSKIRVKDNPKDSPSSYITSVGLYSTDNELLATAKLSEPLKKDPSSTLTLRVRLDY
tara:strand:- start:3563 stop:4600 length:1038 start_codon:yes stop_codon:yes gene_type:complete